MAEKSNFLIFSIENSNFLFPPWYSTSYNNKQAGIECVLIEIFGGVASGKWAFSTKFWLFLGGSIQ